MIDQPVPVKILTMQLIANLSPAMQKRLGMNGEDRAVGLISTDCDDATYIALDEATKRANVRVVYAKSLYAGAANASTALAGEVIGVLAGPTPDEVISGLKAAETILRSGTWFREANEEGTVLYLAHCVSRTGSYLAEQAGIPTGEAVAYLVAPPVEATVGLDAALKAADVELAAFFAPPTETNFSGGLLTGTQSACQTACEAFSDAVKELVKHPMEYGGM